MITERSLNLGFIDAREDSREAFDRAEELVRQAYVANRGAKHAKKHNDREDMERFYDEKHRHLVELVGLAMDGLVGMAASLELHPQQPDVVFVALEFRLQDDDRDGGLWRFHVPYVDFTKRLQREGLGTDPERVLGGWADIRVGITARNDFESSKAA